VTVQIENPTARLKPGMTASCDFLVQRVEDTLYLPSRAVRDVSGTHMVTVLRGKQQAEVPVEVGVVGNERIEILEGVREGTQVVLPSLASESQERADMMRERGRRAGGMGGFFRSSPR
jgi:hypothetical protein